MRDLADRVLAVVYYKAEFNGEMKFRCCETWNISPLVVEALIKDFFVQNTYMYNRETAKKQITNILARFNIESRVYEHVEETSPVPSDSVNTI